MSGSRFLYGTTVFLSAFLLFVIEPIAAKQLLPALGGSSAVWLTCLVFFQTTLLLGYLYAHYLTRTTSAKRTLYIALLAIAVITLAAQTFLHHSLDKGVTHPVTTIFTNLALTIGLPFLLLASTSPLLQLWLSRSEGAPIWYRLFALSNTGSLLALIAYPTLIEPHLSLRHQRTLWTIGFVIYAALCATLATQTPSINPTPEPTPPATEPSTPAKTKLLWFLLPMVAAMQLAAVTSHLTINIAAIPLLWILPLAVYLLTFILAFEYPFLYRRGIIVRLLILMLASLGYALSKTDVSLPIVLGIAFFLVETFIACLFCHAETYALRPHHPSETTLFYLLIAAGGAAGTFFIGIACPLIFSANYDLALTFFLTAVLALIVTWNDNWGQRLLWTTGSVLLFALILMLHTVYTREAMVEVRNFYGPLRVTQTFRPAQTAPQRMLLNGAIQHGTQLFGANLSHTPTTYYALDSGIGLALRFCCNTVDTTNPRPRNLGVIGLGAGTLAAYGQPGDRIRFYELNPLVQPIAQNLFTYIRDSAATITFATGDARASLTHEPPQNFDILVIDAFSSDAIPLHLLTTEALALYRRHLAPGGILAFHVSNQYLNLPPEIAQLAATQNLQARKIETASEDARGEFKAVWVLVTDNESFFTQPEIITKADRIPPIPHLRTWTDDYSTLLPLLKLSLN
jgi:hypothetical protein